MSDLDALLSRPLTDVADNGFSHRAMARIEAEQRRRDAAIWVVFAIGAALVLPFLPLHEIAMTLGKGVPQEIGFELSLAASRFATSMVADLALAAIVLGFVLERQFSRL